MVVWLNRKGLDINTISGEIDLRQSSKLNSVVGLGRIHHIKPCNGAGAKIKAMLSNYTGNNKKFGLLGRNFTIAKCCNNGNEISFDKIFLSFWARVEFFKLLVRKKLALYYVPKSDEINFIYTIFKQITGTSKSTAFAIKNL